MHSRFTELMKANLAIEPGDTPTIGTGLSAAQQALLQQAAGLGRINPSLLSDLEGAGLVADLEIEMARLLGVRHVLALSSGTAALHAALLALDIGRGDEVIVSPYSWGQSVSPVLYTGATPVFADILPDTLTLDPKSVQKQISSRTKAIIPVHLFGQIAPMEPLLKIAKKIGIAVIADGAHALGAKDRGKSAAQFGKACCFSLGRGKLVSGGEGGLLATNDITLYRRAMAFTQHPARLRRIFGPSCESVHDLGLNYRLHPLAALLALAGIGDLANRLAHRRRIWTAFHQGLGLTSALGGLPRSDSWAAYGIPLSWMADPDLRHHFVAQAQEMGVPLRCGPVRIPLHLRLKMAALPFLIPPHSSHHEDSCPVAENQCAGREVWALSAVDMDTIMPMVAYTMGETLRTLTNG